MRTDVRPEEVEWSGYGHDGTVFAENLGWEEGHRLPTVLRIGGVEFRFERIYGDDDPAPGDRTVAIYGDGKGKEVYVVGR